MSNDKKFTTDKTEEVIYRASLKEDFQKDLKEIREDFGIPQNGFNDFRKALEWWTSCIKNTKLMTKYYKRVDRMLIKHKLPPGASDLLENYVLSNNVFEVFPRIPNFYSCELVEHILGPEDITPTEVKWQNSRQPFIKIFIPAGVSLPEAQNFLKRNWSYIKGILANKKFKNKRVRRTTEENKKRDEIIFRLYQKTYKELGFMPGQKWQHKDVRISSILKKKYNIEVTPENIRQIIFRRRRRSV